MDYFAKERLILAIESSCDDTSAAVLLGNTVLSNVVSSQAIHAQYGGVVPELASREHQKSIVPVVELALRNAGVDKKDLEAVAYTRADLVFWVRFWWQIRLRKVCLLRSAYPCLKSTT